MKAQRFLALARRAALAEPQQFSKTDRYTKSREAYKTWWGGGALSSLYNTIPIRGFSLCYMMTKGAYFLLSEPEDFEDSL